MFVIKVDGNGDVRWKRTFGGTYPDIGHSITNTSDGSVLITGTTMSNDGDFKNLSNGWTDVFVIKIDENGSVLWKKLFGGSSDEGGYSISTMNGDILITGSTYSNDGDFKGMVKGKSDIFVMKLDKDGNVLWTKTFGGNDDEVGYSITTTSDGSCLVTGMVESSDDDFFGMNKGGKDVFVIKLDVDGNLLWMKTFGGVGNETGYTITTSSDEGYMITGETSSNDSDFKGMNKGDVDVFIVKLDRDGSILWKKSFGGTSEDVSKSLVHTSDGSLLFAVETSSTDGDFDNVGMGRANINVFKVDKDGEIRWKKVYGGTRIEDDFSTGVSEDDHILLTGRTSSNDGDFEGMSKGGFEGDIFIIKLDSNGNLNPSTSVTDYTSITPSLLVTPNPISTSSTVVFSTGTPTTVRIELLNTLGESVSVLHDGFLESGEHRVSLGVSSVSSGLYYVRMTSEGTVNSTRVVLVK